MSLIKLSRFVCFILRHKPDSIGITLDEHGWANVEELIEGINNQEPFTMEMLEEIVATDDKMRYSFNEDKTLIRANQGYMFTYRKILKQQQMLAQDTENLLFIKLIAKKWSTTDTNSIFQKMVFG